MIEWPLLVFAGLLGSSHCLGMCGGFALAIGSGARGVWHGIGRQLLFTAGRVFTYATLGAAAGWGGERLAGSLPQLVSGTAILAIVAGVFLVYQGVLATGLWKPRASKTGGAVCLAASIYRPFLTGSDSGVLWAGLFTGLLPCGLLYSMLALAASSGDLVRGGLTMVAFGLGTAPALVLAGCGGTLLSGATRRRVFAAAAWCLIAAGGISIARGASFLAASPERASSACPCCTRP